MREVIIPAQFHKELTKFLRKHPELAKKINVMLPTLARDPFSRRYRSHKLQGKLKDKWAARITENYRLVYLFSDETISFLDVGPHDKVY